MHTYIHTYTHTYIMFIQQYVHYRLTHYLQHWMHTCFKIYDLGSGRCQKKQRTSVLIHCRMQQYILPHCTTSTATPLTCQWPHNNFHKFNVQYHQKGDVTEIYKLYKSNLKTASQTGWWWYCNWTVLNCQKMWFWSRSSGDFLPTGPCWAHSFVRPGWMVRSLDFPAVLKSGGYVRTWYLPL